MYVAPATIVAESFIVSPTHKGLLLVAVGADGILLITTFVDPVRLVQPF